MTKQSDRLLVVETKLDGLIVSMGKLTRQFEDYLTEAHSGRIACGRQMSANDVQTRIQWFFIGAIILGLLGMWIKG